MIKVLEALAQLAGQGCDASPAPVPGIDVLLSELARLADLAECGPQAAGGRVEELGILGAEAAQPCDTSGIAGRSRDKTLGQGDLVRGETGKTLQPPGADEFSFALQQILDVQHRQRRAKEKETKADAKEEAGAAT